MPENSKTKRAPMLLVLAVASTLMAEVLTGSTPVSRSYMLLSELVMYGSGIILIREIVRRLKLGWISIILLGVAYGLTEEGLVLQSIMNPHFLGIDNSLGRMGGVNWIWAEYITGLHGFWSITGAILVTELIYFKKKDEKWLNKTGLWIMGGIFLLICVAMHFLFIKISHFQTSPLTLLSLLVLIIAIVFFALNIRPKLPPSVRSIERESASSFWIISVITFVACAGWFLGLSAVFNARRLSPLVIFIWGPFVLCGYFYSIKRLFFVDMNSYTQRLAVTTGLLSSELIWGYFLTKHNPVDHGAQIGFIFLVILLICFLYKRRAALRI